MYSKESKLFRSTNSRYSVMLECERLHETVTLYYRVSEARAQAAVSPARWCCFSDSRPACANSQSVFTDAATQIDRRTASCCPLVWRRPGKEPPLTLTTTEPLRSEISVEVVRGDARFADGSQCDQDKVDPMRTINRFALLLYDASAITDHVHGTDRGWNR